MEVAVLGIVVRSSALLHLQTERVFHVRLSRDPVELLQTQPELAADVTETFPVFLPRRVEGVAAGKATPLDRDVLVDGAEDGKRTQRRPQQQT